MPRMATTHPPGGLPKLRRTNLRLSSPSHLLAGDRVLIDRHGLFGAAATALGSRRLSSLAGGQDLAVKRVVGLPGEKIEISDGDIYADGKIQRKTLRQQRALRILVHDDDYAGAAPRWQPQDVGSNWTASARTPRPCGKHGRRHRGWSTTSQAPRIDDAQAVRTDHRLRLL